MNDLPALQSYVSDLSWAFIHHLFLTNVSASCPQCLDNNALIENIYVSFCHKKGQCSLQLQKCMKKKQLFFSSVDFPWNIQMKADAIQLFHTWFSVILAHLKPLLCLESCPHVWCDMQLFELFSVTCDSWMDKLSGLIVARLDNFCWILWLWKWSLCFTC